MSVIINSLLSFIPTGPEEQHSKNNNNLRQFRVRSSGLGLFGRTPET